MLGSDFYTLSDSVRCLPRLRAREREFLTSTYNGPDHIMKGSRLLIDAKREYTQLLEWPSDNPRRRPCRSYPLQRSNEDPEYPMRLDIYCDTTQAAICNSWCLAQVLVLNIIVNVANFLISFMPCQLTDLSLHTERSSAEHLIREHIDDFCSTIPYIMNPNIKEAAHQYPHGPDSARLPKDPGPEVIAGMSQLKKTLEVASQAPSVPYSQKQWMQQYLTLLSRNRSADQEKALRVELAPSEDPLLEHVNIAPPRARKQTSLRIIS